MNIYYPAYRGVDREIGWIVADDGRIFFAIHILYETPDPPLFLAGNEDLIKCIPASRKEDPDHPDLFLAIEYSKEVDDHIKSIVDALISTRLAHPSLNQLELVFLEGELAND